MVMHRHKATLATLHQTLVLNSQQCRRGHGYAYYCSIELLPHSNPYCNRNPNPYPNPNPNWNLKADRAIEPPKVTLLGDPTTLQPKPSNTKTSSNPNPNSGHLEV